MKTKKINANAAAANATLKPDAPKPVAPRLEIAGEKPDRISFNVKADGLPDWERMSPKTRTELLKVFNDSSVKKELGVEEKKDEKDEDWGVDETNMILDVCEPVSAASASKIFSVPMEITTQAYVFPPEVRVKLNRKMEKLAKKWIPKAVTTWKDEIGLAMLFGAAINAQYRLMLKLEKDRLAKLPRVTPITASNVPSVEPEKPKAQNA